MAARQEQPTKPDSHAESQKHLLASLHGVLPQIAGRLFLGERETRQVMDVTQSWALETSERGIDAQSEELDNARAAAADYFDGQQLFTTTCMDQRTSSSLETGRPPKWGGAARFLGAKPPGIMIAKDGYAITPHSKYPQTVLDSLRNHPNGIFHHDSHLLCAARGDEEVTATGKKPRDGGLRSDVLYRLRLMRALREFMSQSTGIDPLLTHGSFNPHTGDMLFGLDTPTLVLHEEQYDAEALERLVREGKILSTQEFARSHLLDIFTQFSFPADLINTYGFTMRSLWENLNTMKAVALPRLRNALQSMYDIHHRPISERELDASAKIALANAYVAYLNTDESGHYRFGEHEESLGLVTAGEEYGPFATSHLTVERENEVFTQYFRLVQAVIRGARQNGKGYRGAHPEDAIPLVLAQRVHGGLTAEEVAEYVSEINPAHISGIDPTTATYEGIYDRFADTYGNIPIAVIGAIAKSVVTMGKALDPRDPNTQAIYRRSLLPVPVLTDEFRTPVVFLPIMPPKINIFREG